MTIIAHSLGGGDRPALRRRLSRDRARKLVAIEGLGPSPAMQAERAEALPVERMRAWIERRARAGGPQPRRYASIEDAFARMQAENKHLTADQARYLTVHGVSQNEDGTYSWKFDNYVRRNYAGGLRRQRRLHAAVGQYRLPDPAGERRRKLGLQPGRGRPAGAFQATRRVKVFEGAGHWVHHDQLKEFLNEVRAFLA